MSSVVISGDTSGTITVSAPAVSGSNTITLPAETGTARTTVSSGTVLQVVNTQTGAVATGTTTIPVDDTIPQNTEGDQYMSLAITPKSATSKLVIQVVVFGSGNIASAQNLTVALFQDSTANALTAVYTQEAYQFGGATIPVTYYMTSGTTSSTTFKVRCGIGSAGTFTFNGSASARLFGGVMGSSITITEIVP